MAENSSARRQVESTFKTVSFESTENPLKRKPTTTLDRKMARKYSRNDSSSDGEGTVGDVSSLDSLDSEDGGLRNMSVVDRSGVNTSRGIRIEKQKLLIGEPESMRRLSQMRTDYQVARFIIVLY